jgi:GT2 family glycosyltransferase
MVSEKVYIVVLNYNGYKDTIECLDSIAKSNYSNYQVIVVDNASTDNSINHLLSWANSQHVSYRLLTQKESLLAANKEKNSMIFISSDNNGGFASGNNIAIRYAINKNDFDYIWLLNNDTVIKVDTLSLLVEYADLHKTEITGSSLYRYDNKESVQTYGGYIDKLLGNGKDIKELKELDKLEYIVGASMLIKKKLIDQIGLLSEDYFLYYEDADYGYRAREHGCKLGVCVDSIVYHKEGGSTGSSRSILEKSAFSDYHSFKSRKYFLKKYLPSTSMLIYFQLAIYLIHRLAYGKFANMSGLIKAIKEKS